VNFIRFDGTHIKYSEGGNELALYVPGHVRIVPLGGKRTEVKLETDSDKDGEPWFFVVTYLQPVHQAKSWLHLVRVAREALGKDKSEPTEEKVQPDCLFQVGATVTFWDDATSSNLVGTVRETVWEHGQWFLTIRVPDHGVSRVAAGLCETWSGNVPQDGRAGSWPYLLTKQKSENTGWCPGSSAQFIHQFDGAKSFRRSEVTKYICAECDYRGHVTWTITAHHHDGDTLIVAIAATRQWRDTLMRALCGQPSTIQPDHAHA